MPTVKLSELTETLERLSYPIDRADAATACEDVILQLADGTEPLGATIAGSTADTFTSADDLESEVFSRLPQHAVGEPGQSEGEG